jgi:ribosomal protein S18 acetylase RimI-like enzyme
MASSHVLDNPLWYSLTNRHEHLATGMSLAKRYPAEVSLGIGLANHSDAAFVELAQIVAPGEVVALAETNPPDDLPGWQIHEVILADQFVCQRDTAEPFAANNIIELTAADVPDMLRLIDVARPGPFLPRSHEMGRFFGIRQKGELVAMAGERMCPLGYCEISTVCTHPDWQGKGFARRLCSLLIHDNWQKGIIPFLHMNPANTVAMSLYESLHFTKRAVLKILIISHP